MDPRKAIAVLGRLEGGAFAFLGTSFSFRRPDRFLTADHCVRGISPNDLVVVTSSGTCRIESVVAHPSADAAILNVIPPEKDLAEPFDRISDPVRLGEEFHAYGIVADLMGSTESGAATRTFRANVQRLFIYQEQKSYRYIAAELSMASPSGLSGGPIFPFEDPTFGAVAGLVTTNVDVAMADEAFEEVEERSEGHVKLTVYRRVITYGIGLMLYGIRDWIDQQITP